MPWLYLVIAAQFLNAFVLMLDKFLVSPKGLGRPVIYAFYVSALSGLVVFLLPFGVISLPTLDILLNSAYAAACFVISILLFYRVLKENDASDTGPVLGAAAALATVIFANYMLNENLPAGFVRGFPLLIAGTLLLSAFRFNLKNFAIIICAGLFSGLSSIFIKKIFLETSFFNGFFWSRLANLGTALILLLWPGNLKMIFNKETAAPPRTQLLVLFNKCLAGIAFFLILAAIKIGDASAVNALNGLQFLFLLILAFIFTYALPKYFHEAVHQPKNIFKKSFASALIIIGLFILFYG